MAKNSGEKSVFTSPSPSRKGWVNQVGGKVVSNHRTQGTAADCGRDIARDLGAEHVIQRPNGQVREKNSYGNNPLPPRDKQ